MVAGILKLNFLIRTALPSHCTHSPKEKLNLQNKGIVVRRKSQGKKIIIISLLVVLLMTIGGIVYWCYRVPGFDLSISRGNGNYIVKYYQNGSLYCCSEVYHPEETTERQWIKLSKEEQKQLLALLNNLPETGFIAFGPDLPGASMNIKGRDEPLVWYWGYYTQYDLENFRIFIEEKVPFEIVYLKKEDLEW